MKLATSERSREPSIPPGRPAAQGFQAARRHWALTWLAVLIMLAAAAAAGLSYKPTYSAQARLNIGRLDVSTQAIPGYAQAIQTLAVAYARLVTSNGVVVPVADQLHISPTEARSRLDGSAIPQSPVIIVNATASNPAAAILLANAASNQLVAYLASLNL